MRRYKKKLLSNSTRFKKSRNKEEQVTNTTKKSGAKMKSKEQQLDEELQVRSVLFVDNTEGGKLMNRMKGVLKKMASILGYRI